MGWVVKVIPIFILLLALSSAVIIIQSGDNGAQFSADKSSALCKEGNAEAVYICLGNVVKAVSSEPNPTSTFYKPDGRIVVCPVAAPTDMGGECLQMMVPNYCQNVSVCGAAPEKTFPGQNGTPEQAVAPTYVPPTPEISGLNGAQPEQPGSALPAVTQRPVTSDNDDLAGQAAKAQAVPAASPSTFDFALDNLLLIVVGLGVVGMAILFALFRNTLSEDEESN